MAVAWMSQRARQAQMRLKDPRLAEDTYMDPYLLPIVDELSKVPAIPSVADAGTESIRLQSTGTDDAGSTDRAGYMPEAGCPSRHIVAQPDTKGH